MAAGAWALASFIIQRTGSIAAGAAAATLLLVNPNVLYLQSTPMTEPLLFGTTLVAVALVADWVDCGAPDWPKAAGLAVAAACMTVPRGLAGVCRAAALAFAVLLRRGTTPRAATMAIARGWPHTRRSRLRSSCSTADGPSAPSFVSERLLRGANEAIGHPLLAWDQLREGVYRLTGA